MDILIKLIDDTIKNNNNLYVLYDFLRNYDLSIDYKYIKFNDDNYSKSLYYRNNNFDIYYICWKKGQKSKIHSHPNNGCLMKILNGKLKESKYTNNSIVKLNEKILSINDCGYMEGSVFLHDIEAIEDSISVHIYSPSKFIPFVVDYDR